MGKQFLPATGQTKNQYLECARYSKTLSTKTIYKSVTKFPIEANKDFSEDEIQMTTKYMKKCSTTLATREMQTKTILRFHLST